MALFLPLKTHHKSSRGRGINTDFNHPSDIDLICVTIQPSPLLCMGLKYSKVSIYHSLQLATMIVHLFCHEVSEVLCFGFKRCTFFYSLSQKKK